MKKISLLLAILMIAVFAFSACAGTGTKAPANTENPASEPVEGDENGYDGSEVTIRFYHTMGQNLNSVLDEYIAEFNKLYPNIHIDWSQVGGYDDVRDQIRTEITVGDQPNIAYCYPDHVALYNKANVVQTLDSLINSKAVVTRADGTTEEMGLSEAQIADFIEGYYQEGRAFGDGKMYTMPFSKSTEVLYYNKTFFDQNGLKVPTTWDEMYETCKKIKEIDPSSTPLGYDSESNWFITMTEQYHSDYTSATGEHFLFDNDTNRSFIKTFNKWYSEGLVTTSKLYGTYTSGLFVSNKSYMSIGSSAGATHQRPEKVDGNYPFEVGIASIPQVNPEDPKAISQGPSVCIFKANKNITQQQVYASWLFVKYLTTNIGFQADFARASGYVPVIKSVDQDEIFKGFLAKADGGDYIAALSMKVCLEQEKSYFTSPAFVGSSTARDEVGALLVKCIGLTENVDAQIDKAFKDAVEECEYQS